MNNKVNLCQYKNAFGEPLKGFHSRRLFGIALNDLLGTFALAFFTWLLIGQQPYYIHFLVWFFLAIFLHYIFCVETAINKSLNLI